MALFMDDSRRSHAVYCCCCACKHESPTIRIIWLETYFLLSLRGNLTRCLRRGSSALCEKNYPPDGSEGVLLMRHPRCKWRTWSENNLWCRTGMFDACALDASSLCECFCLQFPMLWFGIWKLRECGAACHVTQRSVARILRLHPVPCRC